MESYYRRARLIYNEKRMAQLLRVSERTVRRWDDTQTVLPLKIELAAQSILRNGTTPKAPEAPTFRFIDLFAGIGGTRQGFEQAGGRCVFTSEWDPKAQQTYNANFDLGHELTGDITQVDAASIPDHDVLVAGFPCQPFSIAGVSKKNSLGRKHGFECDTQGTLFYDVARIIAEKQPAAFLLENVKNLASHDRGNTFRVIQKVLTEELGYRVSFRIIDAKPFVPQHRERIFIVGVREGEAFDFNGVEIPASGPCLRSILHPGDGTERPEEPYTLGPLAEVNPKYTLSTHLWEYLQAYARKHRAAGNGFGFGLVTPEGVARTLSARYFKDGSEILVDQGPGRSPRRLTPRECARLMGFPDTYRIPVADTSAYKQFGNSVVVPVIRAIAVAMADQIPSLHSLTNEPTQFAMAL